MSDIKDILHGTFGVNKPGIPQVAPTPKKFPDADRNPITNVYSAISAQRFYDPSFKAMAPPPEAPTAKEVNQGTAQSMSMEGQWGRPPEGK